MSIARIPLAHDLSSRIGSTAKDARVSNAYVETEGSTRYVVKRPGTSTFATTPALTAGTAQGIYSFRGTGKLYPITNNTVYEVTSAGAATSKGTVAAGIYSFSETSDVPYLFFHNGTNAYTLNGKLGTFAAVGAGAGATATVTIGGSGAITAVPMVTGGSGYSNNVTVSFSSAAGSGAIISVTIVDNPYLVGEVYSYVVLAGGSGYSAGTTVSVTLTYPSGTYTLTYPATIVGGVITGFTFPPAVITYLQRYYTVTGVVNAPTGSGATAIATVSGGVITGVSVTAGGTGYAAGTLVSFVDTATQFPTLQTPALTLVPGSVYLDDTTYIMTNTGRIYNSGIEDPTSWNALNYVIKSSEPDGGVAITKHLNYLLAFGDWSGEFFYNNANPTGSPLSRNDSAKMEIGCAAALSVVQILTNQTVIWIGQSRETGRGVYSLLGEAPQKISTKAVDEFLNSAVLTNVRAWSIVLAGHPLYILTLKDAGYTLVYDLHEKLWYTWTSDSGVGVESFFAPEFFASLGGASYVQIANGSLQTLSTSVYQDAGVNINYRVVTPKIDNGDNKTKFWFSLELIGDSVVGTASIRSTNDDYQTWTAYRTVDLHAKRPIIYQLGSARRKAFDITCTSNQPIRLEAMEATVMEGAV